MISVRLVYDLISASCNKILMSKKRSELPCFSSCGSYIRMIFLYSHHYKKSSGNIILSIEFQ